MKNLARIFLIMLILPAAGLVVAKTIPCSRYKTFPTLLLGCEGEGCGIMVYDKAIQDAVVLDHPQTKKEVDTLKTCEQIKEFKPHVWLIKPGSATLTRSTKALEKMGVKKGDVFKVIIYQGEGIYSGCFKSKLIDFSPDSSDSEISVKNFSASKTESWIEVETLRSKKGYIFGDNFYMGHGGFDVSKLCGNDHPFGVNHVEVQVKFLATLGDQIQAHCASNEALMEGRPRCKKNDEIWNELKKINSKLSTCDGFELNKAFDGPAWMGYLNCPKSVNSTEKWQLNFRCQSDESSPKIVCHLDS